MTREEALEWVRTAVNCYCIGIMIMTNAELAACYERQAALRKI